MATAQPRILGRAVRYIRGRFGLTRSQLAEKIGVPAEHIAEFENSEAPDEVPHKWAVVDGVERMLGVSVYAVANVYVTNTDMMDEPFRSLLLRMRPGMRDECERAFPPLPQTPAVDWSEDA